MKKKYFKKSKCISILFMAIVFTLFQSCISLNATSLIKGKTTLQDAQNIYSNNDEGESLIFYKEFISESSGAKFQVYIATEKNTQHVEKDVASQVLNSAIRYLVFNQDNIYVDTVQNPFAIQKNINKL